MVANPEVIDFDALRATTQVELMMGIDARIEGLSLIVRLHAAGVVNFAHACRAIVGNITNR